MPQIPFIEPTPAGLVKANGTGPLIVVNAAADRWRDRVSFERGSFMSTQRRRIDGLAAKVDFLNSPTAYAPRPRTVAIRQTHMSFVFLAGDRVYKLKKPVRFPFLDYSTLARRAAACRAEMAVNRPLAPQVYCRVAPLVRTPRGLAIGEKGNVVDWLVVMRRLAATRMLDRALAAGTADRRDLHRLANVLVAFYRHAARVPVAPAAHCLAWERRISENRRLLSDAGRGLDERQVASVHRAQARFLAAFGDIVAERARRRRIVDGHGDLRPEHIFIGEPVAVIDRLEFSRDFRTVDPFDELAFLEIECVRLGSPEAGRIIVEHVVAGLHDEPPPALLAFYRCYRAAMRTRLMIAHIAQPDGRSAEHWQAEAARYLAIAMGEARRLDAATDRRRRQPAERLGRRV
jgi:uncharacterized protein